jgi:pyrimidine deaminase RibD-like protein
MMRKHLIALLLSTVVAASAQATNRATSRGIKIVNESGSKVELYWLHPQTGEGSRMSDPSILHGTSFPLDSFVGHEFEVRELPLISTGVCKSDDQTCRTGIFAVSGNDDQVITIKKNIEIEFVDDIIRATLEAGDLVSACHEDAKVRLAASKEDPDRVMAAMNDLVSCVETNVAETLAKANEEISFQGTVRKEMAKHMENYTCADLDLNTTEALRTDNWFAKKDRKTRKVQVLFDRPASRIHVIENFIDQEECKAMEDAAQKKLHRATVADGKGGSHLSDHRKAMQSGIRVPWDKEESGDPIARLSRRVYDYTNYVLDLGIEEHGQEDLMSIQYFGRGKNDTSPDRYTPHCDGDCVGLEHKHHTRMATMVMYW